MTLQSNNNGYRKEIFLKMYLKREESYGNINFCKMIFCACAQMNVRRLSL